MALRPVAAAAGLLLLAAAAAPPDNPTRDVDVTYRVPLPVNPGTAILQRYRWSAARRTQRVDLPTSRQWMLLDLAAGRMAVVRDDARVAVEQTAPPAPSAALTAIGADHVAGLACTVWRAPSGDETCRTADGVTLRASRDGRVLLEAVSVSYAPQDPALFTVPAGYAHQSP